jgi:hypothetical protein
MHAYKMAEVEAFVVMTVEFLSLKATHSGSVVVTTVEFLSLKATHEDAAEKS